MGTLKILKSRWFERFARKEGIADSALLEAVERAEKGLIDADLAAKSSSSGLRGRVRGRSKGYRTIILFRRGERAVFMYGFPKSRQDNILADEAAQFKEAARHLLSLTEKQLAALIERGDFVEVRRT